MIPPATATGGSTTGLGCALTRPSPAPGPPAAEFHPAREEVRTATATASGSNTRRRILPALARRRILATRVAAVLVLVPLLWSRSLHEGTLLGESLQLAAMLLIGVGMIGRIWCSAYLAGRKDQTLVTTGPYSLCRNPLYFFSLLGSMGVGFSTKTVSIPAIIGLLFAAVYPAVIRREEAFLAGRFGDRFEAFRARTPCFWPRWSSFHDGDIIPLVPSGFRRRAFECGWFVWGAGIIGAIAGAQAHGLLPVWWHLC